jgi:fructokinase
MYIGIDWGGTKIEAVGLLPDGTELIRRREATPRGDYPGCLAVIARLVAAIESQAGRSGTIGVGIPGSIAPQTGLGKGANSTWLTDRPVQRDLEGALGRPVRLDNDANCLAASEATDGAGRGHRVVFAVIIGTGAGAGIAIDGRAHAGPNTSAGEWGHNPLPRPDVSEVPGPPCYCGRHGCLETFVSGTGLRNDYRRHAGAEVETPEVLARMRQGDRLARMVYERYVDRLARGLALVVNILDPDVIVLGGGMSNVDELYGDLPPALGRQIFSTAFATPIRKAAHGDASGVRGAAWLWRDRP